MAACSCVGFFTGCAFVPVLHHQQLTSQFKPKFLRLNQLRSPAISTSSSISSETHLSYLKEDEEEEEEREKVSAASSSGKLYLETYGCQMNFNDLEVVLAIMKKAGYSEVVKQPEESDVILINTCAIRENAENKIWQRLNYFKHMKTEWKKKKNAGSKLPPKVAVLGCMAERLKEQLIEADKMVDVVCGPDAYRDLPRLLESIEQNQTAVNTLLSLEETYADVSPVRISKDSVTAFVSIMRGCNNMCSYCIVPFTRGRERSRAADSIIREVGELEAQGVREVTLLGQNVNSYCDLSKKSPEEDEEESQQQPVRTCNTAKPSYATNGVKYFESHLLSTGFASIYRVKEEGFRFANLLQRLAVTYPEIRFRFTSPHPKDFPDHLLYVMRDHSNICKSIHLPAQSGSTRILEKMRRGYSRESYLQLVNRIREIIPDVGLSSDFIAGYCGETEEEHMETVSLIEQVGYEMAYMFAYSMREKTHAHRNDIDDVAEQVKQRRLSELIATFRKTTVAKYQNEIGKTQLVLVEAPNKRDPENEWGGRNDRGQKVFIKAIPLPVTVTVTLPVTVTTCNSTSEQVGLMKPGDYVQVKISNASAASLRGVPECITSIQHFYTQEQK